ncbi:MAG: translation initiation factor IF-2 subunit gamma, partial [Candidatus Pacearchaeota archaeon]
IRPQTREHLIALEAKNVKNVAIIQNKIDLVTKEQAIKNYNEIKEFVKGTIAENSPIIPVSAQQKVNIEKIYEYLAEVNLPKRDLFSSPIFLIARSFDINRPGINARNLHGGVLGGSLKRGILKKGDEIEIKPGICIIERNQKIYESVKTKILSIHRGDYEVESASAGGNLAIETELDMSLTKSDNLSGCVAGLVGTLPEIKNKIRMKAHLFKELMGVERQVLIEKFKLSELLMLSINTSISVGRIVKIDDDFLEVDLNIPVICFPGDNVGIARNFEGHWRLIGFGELS